MNFDTLLSTSNYNIGFSFTSKEEMLKNKCISKIYWMKHKYRDRFFADPFILEVNDKYIKVFAEECPFANLHHAGIIVELWIDKKTFRLKKRFELLKLNTHLSYPAIIRKNGKVYVYPESNESGVLSLYEYDENTHKLINPVVILRESVADATISKINDKYIMSATKISSTRQNAYIYVSDTFNGLYQQYSDIPFEESIRCSRSAGDFFSVKEKFYRPAQDCDGGYGLATTIMKVEIQDNTIIKETETFQIRPQKGKYDKGLHTLNFYDNICVVDGKGYIHPYGAMFALTIISLQNKKMAVIHFLGKIKRYFQKRMSIH